MKDPTNDPIKVPGLETLKDLERRTKRERPTQTVACAKDIGSFVADIRRGLAIRQVELAQRAHVGRHWLMALERGKQSCEVELVMRTLETLGFEMVLAPYTPGPPWITVARHTSDARRRATRALRSQRRNGRREAARADRLNANGPRVMPDLE